MLIHILDVAEYVLLFALVILAGVISYFSRKRSDARAAIWRDRIRSSPELMAKIAAAKANRRWYHHAALYAVFITPFLQLAIYDSLGSLPATLLPWLALLGLIFYSTRPSRQHRIFKVSLSGKFLLLFLALAAVPFIPGETQLFLLMKFFSFDLLSVYLIGLALQKAIPKWPPSTAA